MLVVPSAENVDLSSARLCQVVHISFRSWNVTHHPDSVCVYPISFPGPARVRERQLPARVLQRRRNVELPGLFAAEERLHPPGKRVKRSISQPEHLCAVGK